MGSIPVDITGKRYGHLVALRPTGERTKKGKLWELRCDCGNLFYCTPTQLTAGNNVSCGCKKVQPKKEVDYGGFKDCVSYRVGKNGRRCDCLMEMFCATRGKCKFYTPMEKGGAENGT